jgi:DNA end-binding protein Ku
VSKGNYVLLTDEEIENAKVDNRATCELVQFVDEGAIDPAYFDTPYYVLPEDDLSEEPYRVIRDALKLKRKMAIGQIVMRGKEYVVSIKASGAGLFLETLRYADEVRAAEPFFTGISMERSAKDLLDLAGELIDRKSAKFDPEAFHDRYSDTLRELIEEKARTNKPIPIGATELPRHGAQVIDLVEALRRSVSGEGKSKAKAGKPGKRAARVRMSYCAARAPPTDVQNRGRAEDIKMIGLKISVLVAVVVGLSGCYDVRRSYNQAGYSDKINAAWRDAQRPEQQYYDQGSSRPR